MKAFSTWGSIRLWETSLERALHERYSLRSHGATIGTLTLLLTWLVSTLLMHAGVDALALRYLVSLGAGYLAYLLMLRWWAHRLLRQIDGERANGNSSLDASGDWLPNGSTGQSTAAGQAPASGTPPLRSGTGGDFGGGGASGEFGGSDAVHSVAAEAGDGEFFEVAGDALGAAASADEGAVVVVPVVAVFLAGALLLLGAGSLVLLFFGFDVLLAVAIELAFAYAGARAAARVVREGWLSAVARLTWKPLLGALLCAVLLGAVVDHFVPQANSLPGAVRVLFGPR
jgi:hypothetical protein